MALSLLAVDILNVKQLDLQAVESRAPGKGVQANSWSALEKEDVGFMAATSILNVRRFSGENR
jgi:hypothetical protein